MHYQQPDDSTHATVNKTITLPFELHTQLELIQTATGIPFSLVLQHFLETSDLADVVASITERQVSGYLPMPKMQGRKRTTQSAHNEATNYLLMLRPLKPSRKLRDIDRQLAEKSMSDKSSEYVGGNYV